MSLAKKVVFAIIAVVGVTFISATAAYKLIDDKVIEDNALKALQDTLKRKVTVEGDFTLTRSLHPTLKTTGVNVASADWDTGNHLLQAETLEFGISLLDLLRGVISIENIVFKNATINIKRNKEGHSNLEFSSKDAETQDKGTASARFDVVDVDIENLTVNYSDLQSESEFVYALERFKLHPINEHIINIETNSRFDEQPIIINSKMCRIRQLLANDDCPLTTTIESNPFTTDIRGNVSIAKNGAIDLKIESQANNINDLILAKDLSLPDTENIDIQTRVKGSISKASLNEIKTNIALENTKLEITGNVGSLNTLEEINLSILAEANKPMWLDAYQEFLSSELLETVKINAGVKGNANNVSLNNIDANLELKDTVIALTGDVSLQPQLDLALKIDANGEKPAWLDELQQAINAKEIDQFSVNADIKSDDDLISITNLASDISIGKSSTSASGQITLNKENQPNINLNIQSKGENLKDFEALLNQSLPESDNFSVSTLLSLAGEALSFKELQLTLDDTELQGSSDIELSSPPNIRADLTADTLNVEHLLALTESNKDSDANKEKDKKEKAPLFSDTPIDLEWLNTANTNINLEINNLVYKDAKLKDFKAAAIAKNNVASLDITSLKYLDANLTSKTTINADSNTYSHNLFTENFDLGKLLSETKASSTLQGKIDASIDINSIGTSSKQIASNANGKVSTIMTDGSLADAPIDLLASNLLVELMPGKSKKDNTKIECLFVQFSGENGVFKSDAALLNTENIVMTTNGDIDLTNEKLNLLLVPKPKNIELFTLDANIRVSGDLADPGFSLDKGSVFKKLLKSAATVALGPAALAVPFASMGGDKTEKCFNEVASTTTKAVEAQQEAERLAKEQAEKEKLEAALKEAQEESKKEAVVEPLDP